MLTGIDSKLCYFVHSASMSCFKAFSDNRVSEPMELLFVLCKLGGFKLLARGLLRDKRFDTDTDTENSIVLIFVFGKP